MSNELAPQSGNTTLDIAPRVYTLAKHIAATEFVPAAFRQRPDAIMAAILRGHELGLEPMHALASFAVIEGKPTPSAELARALVLRAGHRIWTAEHTSHRCVVRGQRRGDDTVHEASWSIDDAKRAGLAGRQNWQKYPREMLYARATAALCRQAFPDVLGGLTLTEELDDGGEPEPAKTVTRRRPTTKTDSSATTTGDVVEAEIVDPPPEGAPARGSPGAPSTDPPTTRRRKPALTDAQRLAMHAQQRGIDDDLRHHMQRLAFGAESASALDDGQLVDLRRLVDQLADGALVAEFDPDGQLHLRHPDGTYWTPPTRVEETPA